MRSKHLTLGFLALALTLASPALGAGPVDGELGFVWWQTDFSRDTDIGDVSADAGAPGYRGELWFFNRFGVRAAMYSSDLADLGETDSDYMSADLMWRFFSPTERTFLASGLGWQDMSFTESALTTIPVDTSGIRATVQAKVGIVGLLHGFAHYTLLPDLDDYTDGGTGDTYSGMDGHEYELGLAWKMGPFIDMRAGYRVAEFDFTHTPLLAPAYSGTVENAGFFAGLGMHF